MFSIIFGKPASVSVCNPLLVLFSFVIFKPEAFSLSSAVSSSTACTIPLSSFPSASIVSYSNSGVNVPPLAIFLDFFLSFSLGLPSVLPPELSSTADAPNIDLILSNTGLLSEND